MELNLLLKIIKNGELKIYGGKKNEKSDDKYYLLKLAIQNNSKGKELIDDLRKNHCSNVNILLKKDIRTYNPIISQNDVVEQIKREDVSGLEELLNKITNINTSNKIKADNIKFYMFEYCLDGEKVYIFRRNFNIKSLKKSLILKVSPDGIYDSLKLDKFLKMDYEIDLLIFKNHVYIDNHIALERIFYLNEEFKVKASELLDKYEFMENIIDFETIKNKLLNNGRFVRRIAKLSENNERATLFIENIEKTKIAINRFGLPINYNDETQQFEINNKDSIQLNVLVNLMQDSYYETIIGEDMGEDPYR